RDEETGRPTGRREAGADGAGCSRAASVTGAHRGHATHGARLGSPLSAFPASASFPIWRNHGDGGFGRPRGPEIANRIERPPRTGIFRRGGLRVRVELLEFPPVRRR